jgi:ribosomal protein S18 acetylase RimI-like enzyme
MSIDLRELRPQDADALRNFFTDIPDEDRTFFKEDITDAKAVADRWLSDQRSVCRLAFDNGVVVAFAALVLGVERMSHVGDLRLVVASHARRRGIGLALARRMLLEGVEHDLKKVTVDIAAGNEGAVQMFREMGFQPEALLRDHLRDPDGQLHDLVMLAHGVDEQWSAMLTLGLDDAVEQ